MSEAFSSFDARHYETLDVVRGYGEWADSYDRSVDPDLDLPLLEQLAMIPWTDLQMAVDLGCGTGRMGVWLRDRGVTAVYGVDCTEAMIERAKAKSIYAGLHAATVTRTSLPENHFDLAISSLVECHVPDLEAFYAEIHRLLKPEGYFVAVDYHPFFLLKGIPTHFDRSARTSIAIENTVHLISDRVTCGQARGWDLLAMRERLVDTDWSDRKPGMAKYNRQPISLCLAWQKLR